jgi:hypothetical protein
MKKHRRIGMNKKNLKIGSILLLVCILFSCSPKASADNRSEEWELVDLLQYLKDRLPIFTFEKGSNKLNDDDVPYWQMYLEGKYDAIAIRKYETSWEAKNAADNLEKRYRLSPAVSWGKFCIFPLSTQKDMEIKFVLDVLDNGILDAKKSPLEGTSWQWAEGGKFSFGPPGDGGNGNTYTIYTNSFVLVSFRNRNLLWKYSISGKELTLTDKSGERKLTKIE